MRRTGALAAAGLLLVAMTVGAAVPSYANPVKGFAAQARDAGLTGAQATALQARMDTYLARTGGKQVAINKIDLDGQAELVLTLPGETRAREIGDPDRAGLQNECLQYYFCAFSQQQYGGDTLRYFYCAYKLSMPFAGFGSYSNAQTKGTSAHFYGSNGAYMYDSLRAAVLVTPFNWTYVWWIKPCGAI